MRICLSILLLSFLTTIGYSQTVVNGSLVHDGLERNYILYIPSSYEEGDVLPLVFNFHGFTSNAIQQRFYANMDPVAEVENFMVCYPNGVDQAWNVGWPFGSQADDIGFVAAMIDDFAEAYNIDQSKVYACGMSNGGFFSYKLACDLPDRIAAVASVTGSMLGSEIAICNPGLQTPVMQIHGTEDPVVLYGGTPNVSEPISDVIEHWKSLNNCDDAPQEEFSYPDIATDDSSTADRIEYTLCDGDREVVLIRVNGGGHTWPGALINIGVTNQDFDASTEIWNFFNRFSRNVNTNTEDLSFVDNILIAPNPSNGNFELRSEVELISSVEIFSISGTLIRSVDVNSTRYIVEDLTKGLYIARIKIDDEHYNKIISVF